MGTGGGALDILLTHPLEQDGEEKEWNRSRLLTGKNMKAYAVCPGFARRRDAESAMLARMGSAIEPPLPKE